MLIRIIKNKLSSYDNLYNLIYNVECSDVIVYNSIPIKYLDECWLICKLNGFEGYLGDNLNFDIEIVNKNKKFKIKNKRIISFYEKNYLDIKPEVLSTLDSVCYYDIYLDIK